MRKRILSLFLVLSMALSIGVVYPTTDTSSAAVKPEVAIPNMIQKELVAGDVVTCSTKADPSTNAGYVVHNIDLETLDRIVYALPIKLERGHHYFVDVSTDIGYFDIADWYVYWLSAKEGKNKVTYSEHQVYAFNGNENFELLYNGYTDNGTAEKEEYLTPVRTFYISLPAAPTVDASYHISVTDRMDPEPEGLLDRELIEVGQTYEGNIEGAKDKDTYIFEKLDTDDYALYTYCDDMYPDRLSSGVFALKDRKQGKLLYGRTSNKMTEWSLKDQLFGGVQMYNTQKYGIPKEPIHYKFRVEKSMYWASPRMKLKKVKGQKAKATWTKAANNTGYWVKVDGSNPYYTTKTSFTTKKLEANKTHRVEVAAVYRFEGNDFLCSKATNKPKPQTILWKVKKKRK